MSAAAGILGAALLGLWPFGSDDGASQPSVGDVGGGTTEVVEDKPLDVDPARAKAHYARFLELEADSAPAMRAAALRRLGDLTVEEGEALSAEGDLEGARASFTEAAGLYRRFLRDFPGNGDSVDVRYQLARALAMAGDEDASVAELDALVGEPVNAAVGAEAQFRRGDALFSARRWRDAEAAYLAVLRYPDGDFHEQARYKLGWSLFKQGMYEESLGHFFDVTDGQLVRDDQRIPLQDLERAQRELADDSLRAISIGISYTGGPEVVAEYLRDRPRSKVYTVLVYDRLGTLYLDQERYQDAAGTFAAYVDAWPTSDDAPNMQMRVVEAFREGGFADHVLAGKRDYAEVFGIGGGFWDQRQPQDLPEAWTYLSITLDELAEHYHAAAREDADPGDVAEAVRWYRAWLDTFPDDPDGARRQFMLGELLFDSDRFAEAAETYERAAYGYDAHPDAAAAGHASLLAWRAVPDDGSVPDLADRRVTAALRFADAFPEHPEAVAARVDASRQLFDAGDYETALQQSERVAADPSASLEQRRSALLIAGHSAFDLQQYGRAEAAYAGLISIQEDAADREMLTERLAASIYRQGEAAAEAGSVGEAVGHFRRVAAAAPDSGIAATADYDVAVLLMQSGEWADAAQALRLFRSRYPGHEFQDRVTLSLASVLTESGDSLGAADEFSRISRLENQDEEVRRAAGWQAATLYQETASPQRAIDAWREYVLRYPQPLDPAMDARQRLADIHTQLGDTAARLRWLQSIIDAHRAAGPGTDRSRTLAAAATVELADVKRLAYEAVVLSAPLDKSLPAKKASMEVALDAYGGAAEYAIAEVVTQATYRIAQIYRDFGAALMASERPAALDAAAQEQYEILLEEQAFPFEEKAIAIHESNAARSREGLYDEWVIMSFEALADLMPGRYARNEMGEPLVYRLY